MRQPPSYALRGRQAICNVVLAGTYFAVGAISILLWTSFEFGDPHALGSLMVCGVALGYIVISHWLLRLGHYHAVAYLLVSFYVFLAAGIVWSWGINTPIGTLIFGLVIVLAGILLTARQALVAAVVSGSILVGVQVAITFNWHEPDLSWTGNRSSFGDVLGYCTVFTMLALVCWLYNREMERSLAQAKQAEVALLQQKATLELQVEERTAQLRQAQLEEMRHMYRFAELGQLGVTLLHDLANHLTALTLEIEGLQSKRHARSIARARRIIHYLEDIVHSTRDRLHGKAQKQTFNIIRKTSEAVAFLHYKSTQSGVVIDWQPPARSWRYTGDPTCLCQVVTTIASNAIDAYEVPHGGASLPQARRVTVVMQRNDTHITIQVSDWGRGITTAEREQLFQPFHSTKKSGLGLGLFIARQTVETNFSGTLALNHQSDHTEFIITLPRTNAS